jgi:hypothetical protein
MLYRQGCVGQSEGQFKGFIFQRKCNGSNGLSYDLTHVQSLESYQLDDLPAVGRKKIATESRGSG